jgi:hypothetical protein
VPQGFRTAAIECDLNDRSATLMYPLIFPMGRRRNERIAGGFGVPEKNQADGNLAMILLFHPTASPGTAL